MFNRLNDVHKAMLLAFIGYSGFAISDAGVKFLTQGYSVYQISFQIMAAACLIMLGASPFLSPKGQNPFAVRCPKIHALRGILNFLISLIVVYSFSRLPLADTYVILFATPFCAALLGILIYGEHPGVKRWLAIALGFGGVIVAMRPQAGFDPYLALPLLSAFFAALLFTVSRSMEKESLFALGFYPALCTTILSLACTLGDLKPVNLSDLPVFIVCGAGISTGLICVSLAYRSAPVAAVSPFHYSQILWGIGFGWLLFGDTPDMTMLAGAAIVIGSGLWLVRTTDKSA